MDDHRGRREDSPEARAYDAQTRTYAVPRSDSDLDAGGLVDGHLDITGVVRRTFEALAVEGWSLAGIALIVYSPALVFLAIMMLRVGSGLDDPVAANFVLDISLALSNALLAQLLAAGAIVLLFARFRGAALSMGAAVKKALSRVFALVGLAFLVGIVVGVGTLACIVPGLILQAALSMAVPALMVEELSVGEAFSRSFEITRGHRWPIFVVLLFLGLVGGILGIAEAYGLSAVIADPTTRAMVSMPLSVLTSMGLGTLNGIAMVLIYHDLRMGKEGLDEEDLVAAFA